MYFLWFIFSASLVSTESKDDCVMRMELVENSFIKFVNDEELCKCLGYGHPILSEDASKIEEDCDIKTFNEDGKLSFSVEDICGCAGYETVGTDKHKEFDTKSDSDYGRTDNDTDTDLETNLSIIYDTTSESIDEISEIYDTYEFFSSDAYNYDDMDNETYTTENNEFLSSESDKTREPNMTMFTDSDFTENKTISNSEDFNKSMTPIVNSHIINFWNTTVTTSELIKAEVKILLNATQTIDFVTKNDTKNTLPFDKFNNTSTSEMNIYTNTVTQALDYSKEIKSEDDLIISHLGEYSNQSSYIESGIENGTDKVNHTDDLIVPINDKYKSHTNSTEYFEKYIQTRYSNESRNDDTFVDFEDQEDGEEQDIISEAVSNPDLAEDSTVILLKKSTTKEPEENEAEKNVQNTEASVSQHEETTEISLLYIIVLIDTCIIFVLSVLFAIYIYLWCMKKGSYLLPPTAENNLEMDGSYRRS